MAAFDDGDRIPIVLDVYRRACKKHVCGECDREIARGEVYNRQRAKDGGIFRVNVTCRHCAVVARKWLLHQDEGYYWHGLRDALADYDDDHALTLCQAMMNQWHNPETGKLYTLPALHRGAK